MAKSTPGPWAFSVHNGYQDPRLKRKHWQVGTIAPDGDLRGIAIVFGDDNANVKMVQAAPAYAIAWSLVPDEIKQRIFDVLYKPDTEWVEAAIRAVEEESTP